MCECRRAKPGALGREPLKAAEKGRCWGLKAPGLDAQNAVGKAPDVVIAEKAFETDKKVLTVAPYAIELYRFDAA